MHAAILQSLIVLFVLRYSFFVLRKGGGLRATIFIGSMRRHDEYHFMQTLSGEILFSVDASVKISKNDYRKVISSP